MCWILLGALMCPGSWGPALGPNLVRRGHRAPCHLTPWESPLYQAASPPQAQLWKAASSFPGSSWTAWRRTAWSSLAPPVSPLQSPYMMFPQWKTHSSQRLRSQQARTILFYPPWPQTVWWLNLCTSSIHGARPEPIMASVVSVCKIPQCEMVPDKNGS